MPTTVDQLAPNIFVNSKDKIINSSVGFDVTNPIHILVLKLLIINLRLLSFRPKVLFYCDDKINRTIPSKGKKYLTNNGKMSVIKVLHLRAINILDRT